MQEYCESCGGAVDTNHIHRIELFRANTRDIGEFYFVCDECYERVFDYLETPSMAVARSQT